jgi:hypothetical protein
MEQDGTNLAPMGMLFLAVMGTLTLALPRRLAIVPMLATICYMPLGQQLVVAGLHFSIMRLLIAIGLIRVSVRGEAQWPSGTKIDRLFMWWAVLGTILGSLASPSVSLLVNRLGSFYNALGVYFLASCWVKDTKAFISLLKIFALLVIPIAILMVVEKTTSRNVFAVFGGVPLITVQREGHLRCQAAFRHAILAGTFGATLFPLFVSLWFQEGAKKYALAGAISACTIALASSSSGPLMALLFAATGLAFWRWRDRMRAVRRGTVVLLILLALIMNAPIWYIFARLSSVTGGTGWHRAWLIDTTIAHFREWVLFGAPYTANWGGPGTILDDDPDNIDITNQFVLEGVRGGIVKLVLFIMIIVECFRTVGRRTQVEAARSLAGGMLFWGIGVSLFTHCVSFMSVTYFDQMGVLWCCLLAIIARLAGESETEPDLVQEVSLAPNISGEPVASQGPPLK